MDTTTPTAPAIDIAEAHRFLKLLDPAAERFTFQTFADNRNHPLSPGATVWHEGLTAGLAGCFERMQERGAGIYVTVNETDLTGRKIENIKRVRCNVVDLDGAPIEPVMSCALKPHFTVESSPGKYHAYWRVDGLALDEFKPMQRAIAARFGGDKAVCDLPRVMRLPGFLHLKAEPFLTRILWVGDGGSYSAEQVLDAFRRSLGTAAEAADAGRGSRRAAGAGAGAPGPRGAASWCARS